MTEALGIHVAYRVTERDYTFVSRPNRSLNSRQQRFAFWGLAASCMGLAAVFAALGYWLVLPFAGVEVGLLAWAFENLREHAADYESVSVSDDSVSLEWCELGRIRRRELNAHWTDVECACARGENLCRLYLRSHGESLELGRYLTDAGRLELAGALRAKLAKNR